VFGPGQCEALYSPANRLHELRRHATEKVVRLDADLDGFEGALPVLRLSLSVVSHCLFSYLSKLAAAMAASKRTTATTVAKFTACSIRSVIFTP
jgi:hypothetical protein